MKDACECKTNLQFVQHNLKNCANPDIIYVTKRPYVATINFPTTVFPFIVFSLRTSVWTQDFRDFF